MSLLEKEPVKRVEKFLKEFDDSLNIISLDTSARTAMEAAISLKCEVGAIVKSLVFKTENRFTLYLIAGDKKASLNKIKHNLNIKDVSLASADEVKNITGFTIGGVSPIGHLIKLMFTLIIHLKGLMIYMLLQDILIVYLKLILKKLQKITNGLIRDITE